MIYAINKRTGERVVYRQDGSQPEIVGSADWEFVEADAQRAEEAMVGVAVSQNLLMSPDCAKAIYAAIRDGRIPGVKLED